MSRSFGYDLAAPLGGRACMGLIALQADETIEAEFRHMLGAGDAALYVSRVASGTEVTRESLAAMGPHLTASAGLLPRSRDFSVVGYGCTSGTSVIGADAVARAIGQGCRTAAVTNPLDALVTACAGLGVSRLAFLSPYIEEVSAGLRGVLQAAGVSSDVFGSFDEAEEARVARIAPHSLIAAGEALASDPGCEALFLSCTNLRTLDVIAPLEARLGKPVLSSNQVLGWHMGQLAGAAMQVPGRIGAVQLPG